MKAIYSSARRGPIMPAVLAVLSTWALMLASACGPHGELRNVVSEDRASTTASIEDGKVGPEIVIVSPAGYECAEPGSVIEIEAEISDLGGVAVAEFRVGVAPIAVFEGPPYTFSYRLPTALNVAELQFTVAAQNAKGIVASESVGQAVCE